jgi:hypothetical protein
MEAQTAGKQRGSIYLSLPDAQQSYIAGEFEAEVVEPRENESQNQK